MSAVDVHAVVTGRTDAPVVLLSNSLGSTHRMWDASSPNWSGISGSCATTPAATAAPRCPTAPTRSTIWPMTSSLCSTGSASQRARLVGPVPRRHDRHAAWPAATLTGSSGLRCCAPEPSCRRPAAGRSARRPCARQGSRAVAAAVVERWFTPAYLEAHPDARSGTRTDGRDPRPPKVMQACCEAIAETRSARTSFPRSSRPRSPFAGADDPADTARQTRGDRRPHPRPAARRPQAAHLANAEQPGIITPALIEHLEQT